MILLRLFAVASESFLFIFKAHGTFEAILVNKGFFIVLTDGSDRFQGCVNPDSFVDLCGLHGNF